MSGAHSTHPGPTRIGIGRGIVSDLVAHARRAAPNEACGLILGSGEAAGGGRALRFVPTTNAAASPYRYEIDSKDLLRLTLDADDRDEVFWAIVHSHTHTAARPSPTDIGLAFYPDALYILVSLEGDPREPSAPPPLGDTAVEGDPAGEGDPAVAVRAWRIVRGTIFEVALEVVA